MKREVSGTKEWSTSSANCIWGCSHNCKYCYAHASSVRFGLQEEQSWEEESPKEKLIGKNYGKRKGTVMFPTTHDITPTNLKYTRIVLLKLLEAGNNVLVVSKPHLSVMRSLAGECVPYRDQLLFRFTIGSFSDEILKSWEPGAPSFKDRYDSLKHMYDNGYQTSVSIEPLLETNNDNVEKLVNLLKSYITDSIWIGKMNFIHQRMSCNGFTGEEDLRMAKELAKSQKDESIIDLYHRLKDESLIRWKESIKKVVGLQLLEEPGLDI